MMDETEILAAISEEMSHCQLSNEWLDKKKGRRSLLRGRFTPRAGDSGPLWRRLTDVADSVEWIMPPIIESLSGKSVKFRPMSAQDEAQADLETQFTHFVFPRTTKAIWRCIQRPRTP